MVPGRAYRVRVLLVAAIIGLGLAAAGCFGSGGSSLDVAVSGYARATTNGAVGLEASSRSDGATFTWSASGGTFDRTTGKSVVWKAPSSPGMYTIAVTAVQGARSASKTHVVQVVSPPLTVVSWRISKNILGYPQVTLAIRNDSGKMVTAFRVRMYMWNNFGEREDYLGSPEFSGVAPDEQLAPGQTGNFTWDLTWAESTTSVLAWVYDVAFSDGSRWTLYE